MRFFVFIWVTKLQFLYKATGTEEQWL